jgi:uncharacterized membrane protein YbhN (UPF0104 family)
VSGRRRDWLLGALILGTLLAWVQVEIGWAALLAPWRDLPPLQLAGLAALSALSYLCRGARLYVYFPRLARGRLASVLRLSVLHNVANNLLPMRSGEAVFPLLMKRYFGHGYADSAFSLIWIRLLDLHAIGLLALAAAWLARPHPGWWLAALAWLLGLPLGYALRGPLARRVAAGSGRLGGLLRQVLAATPDAAGRLALVYLWTLATWGSKVVAFTAIVLHFVDAALWQAFLGVIGAELSSVLPFHGVAGTGSYELAMVAALVPTGIDAAAALAGAVNLHLFLLGVTLLLGLAALALPSGRERSARS